MEMKKASSNVVYKRGGGTAVPFEPIQNLAKKRPSSTKLDLEKMYEQSLELAAYYKQLILENQQLKEQHQRVQSIKQNRQNLISAVEKIVEQKSKQLGGKHTTNFSWLVFKLNNKIYDLKAKIEGKEKAIMELTLSRQNQSIRQKETEIECLNEIVEFARGEGLVKESLGNKDGEEISQIKEIVWMQQQIKEKQSQIIEAEKLYQQQEKNVRKLMQELAQKKAELKSIREMESQYHRAQEVYKEEKRKKEQRIAGNKTYLEELQNQKAQEVKKLEALKGRYAIMEQEQKTQISELEKELAALKKDYEDKIKTKLDTVIKFSEEKVAVNKKKEVKRVTYDQIKLIGSNLNSTLALKGISHTQIGAYFTSENKEQFSIRQVYQKLKNYPFSMEKDEQAMLVARYTVQDTGDGYFLQDLDTTQLATIIKSILGKLIGQVKIYTRQYAEQLRTRVGPILNKFGRLVQQSLDLKDGNIRDTYATRKQLVSKERMMQALQNTLSSLQNQNFSTQQAEFTVFYLFSWSRNLNELQVARLFTMVNQQICWPKQQ